MKTKVRYLCSVIFRNLKAYKWFLLGVFIYMLYFFVFHNGETNCMVRRIIKFPCPLCGMSRSITSLFTFQFREAFIYHPFIVLMPLLFVVVMFRGIKAIDYLCYSKVFWGIIIGVLLIVYVIRLSTYFPNVLPADYLY